MPRPPGARCSVNCPPDPQPLISFSPRFVPLYRTLLAPPPIAVQHVPSNGALLSSFSPSLYPSSYRRVMASVGGGDDHSPATGGVLMSNPLFFGLLLKMPHTGLLYPFATFFPHPVPRSPDSFPRNTPFCLRISSLLISLPVPSPH